MKVFKFCKKYILHYKTQTLIYVFLGCLLSILSIATPYISGKFIDNLITGGSLQKIYVFCILFACISLGRVIFSYISNIIGAKLKTLMSYELNAYMLNHIKKLPLSYFNNVNSVYLNQRVNMDANSLISFVLTSIVDILYNIITVIGVSVLIFEINIKLFLSIIVLICIYFISYKAFKKTLYKKGMNFKENQGEFFSKLNEQLFQVRFLKINSLEDRLGEKLDNSFVKFFKSVMGYQKISYFFSSFDSIIMALAQISLFFMGGIEVFYGRITIGVFTIIINYFSIALNSVRYFFNLGKSYQDNLIAYDRMMDILKIPQQSNGTGVIETIGNINVENLTFNYGSKNIFENVNLKFCKNNIYCMVGKNGIGKSTLVNIIMGLFVNEYKGRILYNNLDIDKLDMVSVRKNLYGVSEQEPILINDTIYNNIILGIDTNKDEEIKILMEVLNLDKYIKSLPLKMNTIVNEDCSNLSGGEKQKLSILRTLLKDPDILILDEPTSALDHDTKINLINYLKSIKEKKIIIVITHDDCIKNEADHVWDFNKCLNEICS